MQDHRKYYISMQEDQNNRDGKHHKELKSMYLHMYIKI